MLSTSDPDRRLKLRVAVKAMLGALAVAALVVAWGFLAGGNDASVTRSRYALAGIAVGATRTVGYRGRAVIVLHRPRALAQRLAAQGRAGPSPAWFVAFATGTSRGCPVIWEPARESFRETCGDARYDAAGHPVAGSEIAPLHIPPYRIEGDTLVLGPG